MGQNNQPVSSYKHDTHRMFGSGKQHGVLYWKSLLRQIVLNNFLAKDVDHYGLLLLTDTGKRYIDNPYGLKFILNQPMEAAGEDSGDEPAQQSGGAVDTQLLTMLKELRKKRSEERRVGKSVSVRVDLGGRRMIQKKNIK